MRLVAKVKVWHGGLQQGGLRLQARGDMALQPSTSQYDGPSGKGLILANCPCGALDLVARVSSQQDQDSHLTTDTFQHLASFEIAPYKYPAIG